MNVTSILPNHKSYKGRGCVFTYGFAFVDELGELFLARDEEGALVYVGFNVDGGKGLPLACAQKRLPHAEFVMGYVALTDNIVLHGTEFQQSVWAELLKIPRGKTVSYGDVAAAIGNPKAGQAVGGAVGSNPISLFVPCHRVIQSNGSLNNYLWGNDMKRKILKSEGAI